MERPRVADRGNQARDRAAQGVLGGNIINAFARGSGKPVERTRGGVTEHVSGINSPPPTGRYSRHNGEKERVHERHPIPCPHCPMTFVNEQGLGIHVKTQHSNANMSNGLRLQRMLGKTPKGKAFPGGNIISAFARGSGKPIEQTRGGVTEHVSGINFPPPAPERRLPCPHCPMTFVNEQGLGIHVKTQHSNANMSNGLRLQRMQGKTPKGYVQPWEEAGPGRCWHVKVDGATGAASFVLQRKRFRDLDLESDGFTDRKVKETRGAAKRKRYDSDLFKEEQLTPLQYLEDRLKVNYSLIVKYDVKKTLLAKQKPKRWFPEEEKKLYNMFLARRRRKLKVSTLWLTVTFRKLVQENHPEDQRAAAFSASFRWARKWAKRHKLSKRRRSNLKDKSVEERLPKIQRFHRRFRELLQEPVRYRAPEASDVSAMSTVAEGESRDPKYGQFQLWER
ncbi:unnamed protein product [Ectocarpus sp. CCAP 1310/34]|nr:unnamed protein product [Ectocarpus sp. CCAP 1310/34]